MTVGKKVLKPAAFPGAHDHKSFYGGNLKRYDIERCHFHPSLAF